VQFSITSSPASKVKSKDCDAISWIKAEQKVGRIDRIDTEGTLLIDAHPAVALLGSSERAGLQAAPPSSQTRR